MITAIAIDDEPLALQVIEKHAGQVSFLNLKQTFTGAAEAIKYLSENATDLIFLDIKMPDINGVQLAEWFAKDIQIVFTTAYTEYAVKGFELDATDYLLKPVSLLRFLQACQKAEGKKKHTNTTQDIFFKNGSEWLKIHSDDILYAEAQGNYIKLATKKNNYLLRLTFKELLEQLPPSFLRVHKSYVINSKAIERIEPHQLTIDIYKLPIGKGYRQSFMDSMGLKASETHR